MRKIIAEVTVVPLGTGTTSLSTYVADTQKVLEKYKDLNFRLTPMSTVIEGEIETVFHAILQMHESPFLKDAKRVSTRISIDDRRDKDASIDKKLESVRSKL